MGLFDFFKKILNIEENKDTGSKEFNIAEKVVLNTYDLVSEAVGGESKAVTSAEKWIVATYAMWSEYNGGKWYKIGGHEKNEMERNALRKLLSRDWQINDKDEGLDIVVNLISTRIHNNIEADAWDYCRAMQLLGMFYISDYLEREEMMEYASEVAEVIKENYNSWEEMCESYLKGYAAWRNRVDAKTAQKAIDERREIYNRLKNMPNGPYSLDWNTEV